jgi:hypothetical protein
MIGRLLVGRGCQGTKPAQDGVERGSCRALNPVSELLSTPLVRFTHSPTNLMGVSCRAFGSTVARRKLCGGLPPPDETERLLFKRSHRFLSFPHPQLPAQVISKPSGICSSSRMHSMESTHPRISQTNSGKPNESGGALGIQRLWDASGPKIQLLGE